MTETVMPKEVVEALKPDYVAPLVLFLAHESCPENGALIEVGAGYIAKQRWQRSEGVVFRPSELTPENIKSKWGKITDFTKSTNPTSNEEIMAIVMSNISNPPPQETKQEIAARHKTEAAPP